MKEDIERTQAQIDSLNYIMGDPSDMVKDIYKQLKEIILRLEKLEKDK